MQNPPGFDSRQWQANSFRLVLEPIQTPIHWQSRALSPSQQWPTREGYHSPPVSAEGADAWSYTSTHPYAPYLLSSPRHYGSIRWPLLFVRFTQEGGSCTITSKAELCLPVLQFPQLCTQGGDPATQRHVPGDRSALSWSCSCAPLEGIRGWGGGMTPLIINL